MKTTDKTTLSKTVLYSSLLIIFLICLWVAWSEFNPLIAQDVIRDNIRCTVRWAIQISIQYIVPVAIVIFFVKEIIASRRSKAING
jgi:hypothetical protein